MGVIWYSDALTKTYFHRTATTAPEIVVAEPVVVDGSEPVAEVPDLTEPLYSVPQHVICSQHYIMSEEDDYSMEFNERSPFERQAGVKAVATDAATPNATTRAPAGAVAKKATAATGPTDVNALVMRSLQKLLASNNLGSLVNPRNGNVVRRVNNGTTQVVRRQGTANNVIQKRRYNPNASFNGNVNGNVRNNRRFI